LNMLLSHSLDQMQRHCRDLQHSFRQICNFSE